MSILQRIGGFLTPRFVRYDEGGWLNRHLVKGPIPMKTLTITLPDEIYEAAEQAAGRRGGTLRSEIVTWISQSCRTEESNGTHGNGSVATEINLTDLFAALDRARNVMPVGKLLREELYGRRVAG